MPHPNPSSFFEGSPELVWTIDRSCRLTGANQAFRAFLQRAQGGEPSLGAEVWEHGPPLLMACYERALRGEQLQIDLPWGEHVLELAAAPLEQGRRITGALLHARDASACLPSGSLTQRRDARRSRSSAASRELRRPKCGPCCWSCARRP